MAGYTDHYGLSKTGAGDSWSDNGYKHSVADRDTIDAILYINGEGHRHTGASGTLEEPVDPLQLTLNSTGGGLPSGTRIYYKWTYVNSETGQESVASPEVYIDTDPPIASPGAPSISYTPTGGTLAGGNYFYVLSAYVTTSTAESKATSPAYLTVPGTTATNKVTLSLPSLPVGATGFNVYRRLPGQSKYFWLDSIDMSVATPPSTYEDAGVEEDCDRTLPVANTTNSTSTVDIELPPAITALPTGYTWKIYRTYIPDNWINSLLHHVVEYTAEATPIITTTYTDTGIATSAGTFPSQSVIINSPSKVDLTDSAEVQGNLPLSAIAITFPVTFQFAGTVTVGQGSATWVCPFPLAEIVSVQANLGRGSIPASTDVVVDVNYGAASANPIFSTAFSTQANRPTVPVGAQVGARTTPDTTTLARGDCLTVDVDQAGGGATPTDQDLCVTIYLITYGYPTLSYQAGQSGGAGGDF